MEQIIVAGVLQEAADPDWRAHKIPSVSWLFHDSLHFHIYKIVSFVLGIPCPLYCYYK